MKNFDQIFLNGCKIDLCTLEHNGNPHIALCFEYNPSVIATIKTLPDRRYAPNLKAWLLPDTPQNLSNIKKLELVCPSSIKEIKQESNSGTIDDTTSKDDHTGISSINEEHSALPDKGVAKAADIPDENNQGQITIVLNNQNFAIKMPYNQADTYFLKSLTGTWWHKEMKQWMCRATESNLRALQARFNHWGENAFEANLRLILMATDPYTVTFYSTPEFPDKIIVKIRGFGANFEVIKRIEDRHYDQEFKRWIIPFDAMVFERLKKHYQDNGAKVIDRCAAHKQEQGNPVSTSLAEKQTYLLSKFPAKYTKDLQFYTDALIRMRYSWNTVTLYSSAFFHYLEYLGEIGPDAASSDHANAYLSKLSAQKVSESLIHTAVNSIKFYYEKVVFNPSFKLAEIARPKKSHHLPTILSIQEVDRMLRSVENVKHVAILYALYSGGLRLNEMLTLRCQDVLWERNQLFIKDGKGKKDRYVMLSMVLKQVLRHYFDSYQPKYWLFESQDKSTHYGQRSVQQIVKRAAEKAGISRNVSPHTLRHCFATHLLDGGTDVRYIQELLGHKDIKTTLIYTHVTNRSLEQIKSPLDVLNLRLGEEKMRNDATRNTQ